VNGIEVHVPSIRRIVVALDGSEHSLAALDAAAALAAQLQSELEALFVEDDDLLRLAELPFARVTSLVLLESRPVDRERMERQLRLQAERVERTLQRRAAALGLHATFRHVRGRVCDEVLAAAAGADLLSLGKAGGTLLSACGVGRTLQAALGAGRPLLVLENQPMGGEGFLAVYDGSAADRRALALAAELAEHTRGSLQVLALAPTPGEAEHLGGEVEAWLEKQGIASQIIYAWGDAAVAVLAAARGEHPALLLMGLAGDEDERATQVLAQLRCPLLLVP